MCMLTYFPPGQQPSTERLMRGAAINDDGHGFAIVCESEILVAKYMDALAAIDDFAAMRRELPDGPALFHSRWATDGAVNLANVHPFYVGKDKATVVGHNGIISKCTPRRGDSRSDTRILAEHHLAGRNFDKERSVKRLEDFIGWSKLVILTVDPRYKRSAYIVNESMGYWRDGAWYSNQDYLGRSAQSWHPWEEWYRSGEHSDKCVCYSCQQGGYTQWCGACSAVGTYIEVYDPLGYCRTCRACGECEEQYDDGCMCYLPSGEMSSVLSDTDERTT